jgi:hypothetical protein
MHCSEFSSLETAYYNFHSRGNLDIVAQGYRVLAVGAHLRNPLLILLSG